MTDPVDKETEAALIIARVVYGGVLSDSPQWKTCLDTARALGGGYVASLYAQRKAPAEESFKACSEFNKKNPLGTSGVLNDGQQQLQGRVEQGAMVFPDLMNGETVMAWFSGVGWRDIKQFSAEVKMPTDAEHLVVMAQQARAGGNLKMMKALLETALILDPGCWHAINDQGTMAASEAKFDEAIERYTAALALTPKSGEILNNRALAYRNSGRLLEAAQDCEQAHKYLPGNDQILQNTSMIYDDVGRVDDALALMDLQIERSPDNAFCHYNKALLMLGAGRLAEGWKQFEWRLRVSAVNSHYEHFDAPRWNGQSIDGKTVLIWPEQGLGDEIITASMIPDAIAAGAKITLLATDRMVPLFERSFPEVQVLQRPTTLLLDLFQRAPLGEELLPKEMRNVSFDLQMSQADLGQMFRQDVNAFPKRPAFLSPNIERFDQFRCPLDQISAGNRIVGISWHSARNIRIGNMKGGALKAWAPILKTPGMTFVNLQYGDCTAELAEIEKELGVKVVNFTGLDPLRDMDGFASLVSAMDLVLTVSNTTAHVAGALGVPTWVILAEGPGRLWYWFRDRTDSPWYPSLHLFRQPVAMAWQPVIDLVASQLVEWAKA